MIRIRPAVVLVAAAIVVAVGVPSLLGGTASQSRAQDLSEAVGAYRFPDGSVAALFLQDASLRLVDYENGELRELTQVSPDEFVGGPGVHVLRPVMVHVGVVRSPSRHVVGLRRARRLAARIPLVEEPAAFSNGDVRLAGRLLKPAGRGLLPAVVIVPGSVPAAKDTYDLWAFFFASRGFAVLTYDKRGVGESGGHYVKTATEHNLTDLAGDALAAVDWLRTRPEIDPARIGLSGGSQAGFTIPLAASESSAVAFATIQSGPVTSVARQLAYGALTEDGARVPPATGGDIQAALDGVPDSGFDPRPALAKLHIPMLWQLGGLDKRQYTPESVANLAALTADGTHDFTVHVYPAGAHSLRETKSGLIVQELRSPGFVPGLFDDLDAWLRARGF